MSILDDKIRSWWLQKPVSNNMPIGAVFERFRPTIIHSPNHEWVRVVSLDDLHMEIGQGITHYVSVCSKIKELEQKLAEAERVRDQAIQVVRFYGDKGNWVDEETIDHDEIGIHDSDWQKNIKTEGYFCGGKRAREFLAKLEEGKE